MKTHVNAQNLKMESRLTSILIINVTITSELYVLLNEQKDLNEHSVPVDFFS